MKKNLIILIVYTCMSALQAQNNFVKGYIIGEKGDTTWGEGKVNPKKESDAYDKVFFKDANGIQKTYKANKIQGYGLNNEHFISLENDGEPKFYKVLARGDINLYQIVFEAMQMNAISYDSEYYLSQPDNKKLVVVKQNKFKKQIGDWMKDNPSLIESYTEEKKFDAEKATALITQYNAWKSGNAR